MLLCLLASSPSLAPLAQHLSSHAPLHRNGPLRMSLPQASSPPLLESAIASLQPTFATIDRQTEASLGRVLRAFRRHGVGAHLFGGVNGYGHGDLGRDALDSIYAELMGAEAAIVRVQCFSGTHAIACCLFGVLRPGQTLLAVSGAPYDTLEEVIGLRGRSDDGLTGTLADFGVSYKQVELQADGRFDLEAISDAIEESTRVLHVQRSCGYAWRPSIPVAEIGRLAEWLKANHPLVHPPFIGPTVRLCWPLFPALPSFASLPPLAWKGHCPPLQASHASAALPCKPNLSPATEAQEIPLS